MKKNEKQHLEDRISLLEWERMDHENNITRLVRENEVLWELVRILKENEND